MTHERIIAEEIKPGDRVARSRNQQFATVAQIQFGPIAVRLLDGAGNTIARPRRTARWWRETA
jgi:hypothetical protein